ncbi:MAG: hypothetical protein QM723_12160 [Myxococcaceae bacterium]
MRVLALAISLLAVTAFARGHVESSGLSRSYTPKIAPQNRGPGKQVKPGKQTSKSAPAPKRSVVQASRSHHRG